VSVTSASSGGGDEPTSTSHAAPFDGVERLATSLADISRLQPSRFSLEDLLTRVATHAVRAVPGAEGAGLTLLREHGGDEVAPAASFLCELDQLQHRIGEGPGLTAIATRQAVLSGSLDRDPRWPRFGGAVARHGVQSALSLPLATPDEVVGALTLYARAKDAFDHRAADMGRSFAGPATITVLNAKVLAHAQDLAAQLQAALDSRAVIDRAVGIVMSRSGSTEEEALRRLRALSQHEHLRLSAVAGRIVDEAVRRAHARQHFAPPADRLGEPPVA
jgi:transcriptional regulator with GAF, ATPase, and Fis domain